MTINDSELSRHTTIVHENDRRIDYLTREGQERALFLTFLQIRNAAEDAMDRLNRMQKK